MSRASRVTVVTNYRLDTCRARCFSAWVGGPRHRFPFGTRWKASACSSAPTYLGSKPCYPNFSLAHTKVNYFPPWPVIPPSRRRLALPSYKRTHDFLAAPQSDALVRASAGSGSTLHEKDEPTKPQSVQCQVHKSSQRSFALNAPLRRSRLPSARTNARPFLMRVPSPWCGWTDFDVDGETQKLVRSGSGSEHSDDGEQHSNSEDEAGEGGRIEKENLESPSAARASSSHCYDDYDLPPRPTSLFPWATSSSCNINGRPRLTTRRTPLRRPPPPSSPSSQSIRRPPLLDSPARAHPRGLALGRIWHALRHIFCAPVASSSGVGSANFPSVHFIEPRASSLRPAFSCIIAKVFASLLDLLSIGSLLVLWRFLPLACFCLPASGFDRRRHALQQGFKRRDSVYCS
ncbi:hypothetical protein K438DRAFT_1749395 [Mycena galopus ATCC 62051]|nr:hypothetical protein K438DRAFT_1749395 [Mycena galopus ATCC 62051]